MIQQDTGDEKECSHHSLSKSLTFGGLTLALEMREKLLEFCEAYQDTIQETQALGIQTSERTDILATLLSIADYELLFLHSQLCENAASVFPGIAKVPRSDIQRKGKKKK